MTDQTDVREFLHRMANEAGFAPVEPGPVVGKARRRLARSVGATLLTAGALVAGALVAANGLMNADRTQMPQPGGQPTPTTTENGQAVGQPYSILDGEVTFQAAPPWDASGEVGDQGPTWTELNHPYEGRFRVLADPLPIETGGRRSVCREGPASADAEALARSIRSYPNLEATAPVPVDVGGIEALRMDVVTAAGASVCVLRPWSPAFGDDLDPGHRMRLYLLDLPGRSARILAIAIVAPEPRFQSVVEAAALIVDSFEFHTR